MADRMFASTRKGLIEYGKAGGAWSHTATHFIGQPVTNMLADGRDGTLYAALDLGKPMFLRRKRSAKVPQPLDDPLFANDLRLLLNAVNLHLRIADGIALLVDCPLLRFGATQ